MGTLEQPTSFFGGGFKIQGDIKIAGGIFQESPIKIGIGAETLDDTLAIGINSAALGDDSLSIGKNSKVTEQNGISIGQNTEIKGKNSIGIGNNTTIHASNSIGIGDNLDINKDNVIDVGSKDIQTSGNIKAGGELTEGAAL